MFLEIGLCLGWVPAKPNHTYSVCTQRDVSRRFNAHNKGWRYASPNCLCLLICAQPAGTENFRGNVDGLDLLPERAEEITLCLAHVLT